MSFPSSVRLGLLGLGAVISLVACSAAPPSEDDAPEETAESALSGCGHLTPSGVLVGQAPNACVPGAKEYTTAGCAQHNGRRVHACDSNCRWGSFSATCECQPTSCAGRICGDDGCGGSCGSCPGYQQCNAQGTTCFGSITGAGGGGGDAPACLGRSCGPDGVGGTCGTCPVGSTCDAAGQCSALPPPVCRSNASVCGFGAQCCSGNCYQGPGPVMATCVKCLPSTTIAFCSKDIECCSGLCDTHDSVCVNVCKKSTSQCSNSAQCCSGNCSSFGFCL